MRSCSSSSSSLFPPPTTNCGCSDRLNTIIRERERIQEEEEEEVVVPTLAPSEGASMVRWTCGGGNPS